MSDTLLRQRLTLRQLPLATRVVLTVFLAAVGLGYFSALVQLHIAHSDQKGSPLPTPNDVVKRFSYFEEFDGTPPKSHVEDLISGHRSEGWGASNMTPAFFDKSSGYKTVIKLKPSDPKRKRVDDSREAERLAVLAFIHLPADQRKAVYEADAMELPAALKGQPIPEEYVTEGKVCIACIIKDRCVRCHGDRAQQPNLSTFEKLEPYITPATEDTPREALGKKWVGSSATMGTSKLVQSTHAHALSFAVLFALTGLVYSISSHPRLVRGVLAPVVLVAQVADVSCWWLARLDLPWGPVFAQCIMATGGVVGLGLSLQIVLSLFDMFGWRGRAVLALLAAGGLAIVGAVYVTAIHPALVEQKRRAVGEQIQAPPQEPQKQPDPKDGAGRQVPVPNPDPMK